MAWKLLYYQSRSTDSAGKFKARKVVMLSAKEVLTLHAGQAKPRKVATLLAKDLMTLQVNSRLGRLLCYWPRT
jgi:hypothetical protein